ncbi:NADH kinase, partial [Malassezia psittaci]
ITVPRGHIDHGERRFSWQQSPRNVLLLKKMNDDKVDASLDTVIEHVRDVYPEVNLIVEESVYEQTSSRYPFLTPLRQDEAAILAEKTDFVITLGGDGSILHASSLFNQTAVPPILSFSMGTLGFLLPYNIESYQEALKDVFESRFHLLLRMRMSMTLWDERTDQQLWLDEPRKCHEMHFLNEMVLHRGSEPHMTTMDAFVNGEHLTRTIADGLIVSTPTGSTAYSLSAGGPIVHPTVSTMMLTPISPRSLSFRTILLPSDATLEISVSKDARAPAEVSVDGHIVRCLSPNQSVSVEVSPYPMPCIDFPPDQAAKRRCGSSSLQQEPDVVHDDWVHDINNLLRFNASFLSRGRDQDTIEKDRSSVSSRRRWERRQHMRQAEITGSDSR